MYDLKLVGVVFGILALGWLMIAPGCAVIETEIEPRVQEAFVLYFGVNEDGKLYETRECFDPREMHQVGIRHIVCQQMDQYPEPDRDLLIRADERMFSFLEQSREFHADAEKVKDTVLEVIRVYSEFRD